MARQPRICGTTVPRVMVNGLWANPPFALVQRIYREARKSVACNGGQHGDVIGRQLWLRRVSAVFHARLRKAGIYVEGA